jgi:hypothetical protein
MVHYPVFGWGKKNLPFLDESWIKVYSLDGIMALRHNAPLCSASSGVGTDFVALHLYFSLKPAQ